jgi:UDP-N-acetylglucosamine 4,6-dehydratase
MTSILITGGTGGFGRAMTRYLLGRQYQLSPGITKVAIYSRGEHAQAQMAEGFDDERLRFFIGDVRDRDRLKRAMHGIDVVIHAAALKRIEVGKYNPTEMVKTNIGGAINVIEAAHDVGVSKVVALSTDKAYQPISPYGQSKALAESLFLNAYRGGPEFCVTRYGNVWKSPGSVVLRWQERLKNGVGIDVTDPECTRFFMTMDEAVQLVAGAVDWAKQGELVIPKLPAYRLGDLVMAMGHEAEITGLPEWEKRHEGMADGNTSDVARRMTVEELRAAL